MKNFKPTILLGVGALALIFSSCGGPTAETLTAASTPSYSTHPQFFPEPQAVTPQPVVKKEPVVAAAPAETKPAADNPYVALSRPQPVEQPTIQRPQLPERQQVRANPRKLNNLYEDVNVSVRILPRGARSRTNRPMTPRYITIHSTQNTSEGADAWRHQLALSRGALGAKSWHYTTDESNAVQHIPLNEQGNHAENYRGGPGNVHSIGIEMCENKGNNIGRTIDRTAKLTAYLMHKHNIPLANVKPHYHWPRRGVRIPNKNCPRFLMDDGRPGRKWQGYLDLVESYYKRTADRDSLVLVTE